MMWNHGEWWRFGMGYGFHWVFMIAFWVLVIWALIAFVRRFGVGGSAGSKESAQAILERRFARGELSAAELKKMMHTLAKGEQ